MAGTIKGISVKISGDTVDLKDSMKDIEKISKSLQSELNLVNKQLKFDPSNSVLLAQKQEILEEKIANTKESLAKLESVQKQVEEQAQSGELGADKYRAYQRELETTKNILKNLENQLTETKEAQNKFENEINSVNLVSGIQEVKDLKNEIGNLDKEAENTDLSNLKREMDDVKSSASNLKDTLKDTATEVGAGIAVAGGVVTGALASYNSVESAMNAIKASTTLTTSEVDNLRTTLENIYSSGTGESLEDIANRMANIVQVTNETDPTKIEKYVRNLYSLEDLDMDFNETLRGVQGLITNMGLSADEAFDLIASGAQNGLNYSGELADNISEYSQIWGQAGFSAQEMFAILDNGTESGAYNLDKVNDFVKEFTISLSDGRIEENIKSFSSDTQNLFKEWKKGKATSADVFYSVINDLSKSKSEQEALTTASTVWSSLGEDNAMKVIESLGNVNTKFDDVKGTMEEVNEVKYDNAGNKLESLSRKVQTEVINPFVEDAYPVIEDGIEWVSDHLDDLIPIIKGLGKQVAIVWGVKKATEITKGVMNLISSYKTLATATKTATDGQKLLNSAQKANVISAVVTGVLTLINAINTYNETQWENSSLKKEIDKTNELTEEWNDLANEISSKVDEINDTELSMKVDFENIEKMKERLQEIIKDGTIDESEKGEYQTIVDLLSEKVDGFETDWNSLTLEEVNGKIVITDNIDEVNTNLDELIEKWEITQAKLTLSNTYSDLQTEIAKKNAEISALDTADLETSKKEFINYIFENSKLSKKESEFLAKELLKANGDFEKAAKSIKEQLNNASIAKEYENLFLATTNAYYTPKESINALFWGIDDVEQRINEYTDSIVENEEAIDKANSAYDTLRETSDGYYEALKTINGGQKNYNEYIKLSTEYGLSHEAVLSLLKDDGIKTWDELVEKSKSASDEIITNASKAGKETPTSFANGINETIDEAAIAAGQVAITAKNNLDFDSSSTGSQLGIDFADALERTNPNASNAAASIREAARSGFGDTYAVGKSKGNDYGEGFVEGINEKVGKAILAGANIAISALKGTQEAQDSHSPAKKSRFLGNDNGDGFVLGVMDKIKDSFSAGKKIAKAALSGESYSADTVLSDFKLPNIDISSALSSAQSLKTLTTTTPVSSSKLTKNVTNAPVINVAVNGTQISNDYDINKLADKVSVAIAERITNDGMKWG